MSTATEVSEPALATEPAPVGDEAPAADGGVVVALAQLAPRLGDVPHNLRRHLALVDEARAGGAHLVVFPELSLTGYFLKDLVPDAALREDAPELADLAQIAPRLGDVPANLRRHLQIVEEARRGGAHLVVFPELSLTGYFLKDLVPDVALREDAPELADLARAAEGVDVVAGAVLESEDARFYNAALYFSGGRLLHVHRKVYLPTYGLFDEQRYFAPGDRFRAFDAPLPTAMQRRAWRAGVLVCEDMWHLSAPSLLARQGVDVILCPSSSPGRGVADGAALGTAMSYDAMTRTYAQLTTSYLLYCNRTGFEDGVHFWGGSRVVDPEGRVCAEAGDGEQLLWHRLDLAAIRRVRLAYPLLRDARHDVTDCESARLRREHRDGAVR